MPTGRSPRLDAHQPTVIITPTAAPVIGHRHLPCWGSPRPRQNQTIAQTASTAMMIHGERWVTLWRVGGDPSVVMAMRWRAVRAGASTPTPTIVAPIANPRRITPAPIAPSPRRYQVLPEQPPEMIMPTPKSTP